MEINFIRPEVKTKDGVKRDKRLLNTKQALISALILLLAEKDIGEISITELTQKAGINRKTFYLHYEKLEDVVSDFCDDLFVFAQGILLKATNKSYGTLDIEALFSDLSREISANLDFFKIFVTSDAYRSFVNDDMLKKLIGSLSVCLKNRINDPALCTYTVEFLAGGVSSMYKKWLCSTLPTASLDTVSKHACTLVLSALNGEKNQHEGS